MAGLGGEGKEEAAFIVAGKAARIRSASCYLTPAQRRLLWRLGQGVVRWWAGLPGAATGTQPGAAWFGAEAELGHHLPRAWSYTVHPPQAAHVATPVWMLWFN